VDKPIHISGAKHEAAAELKWILAEAVLAMARRARPCPGFDVIATE